MKKNMVWLLSSLLLVSCQISPLVSWKATPMTPIDGFKFDQHCPHGCWMDINPGYTTAEEVKVKLKASSGVELSAWQEDNNEIYVTAKWFTRHEHCDVDITLDNGIVKNIYFGMPTPFKMSDIISAIGEPDEIGISKSMTPDAGILIPYLVYYRSQQLAIVVGNGRLDGPSLNDDVDLIILNVDKNSIYPIYSYEWQHLQPWIGFGHLNDYLPVIKATP
jgi:hypothetical protein